MPVATTQEEPHLNSIVQQQNCLQAPIHFAYCKLCCRYVAINGNDPAPPWKEWPQLLIQQAKAILPASTAAVAAIKEVSSQTRIFLDEVG
eukprot:SAG31_NODE_37073_length_307_cov_1.240385_1_plen_89_part_01